MTIRKLDLPASTTQIPAKSSATHNYTNIRWAQYGRVVTIQFSAQCVHDKTTTGGSIQFAVDGLPGAIDGQLNHIGGEVEIFTTLAVALIAAAASITSALIAANSNRSLREQKAKEEEYQAERRQQEEERRQAEHERMMLDEVQQQSLLAIMDALDVSLISLQGGHLNGNVEEARSAVRKAKDAFQQTRTKAISHTI
jgi:hypothetical protein